MIRPGMVIGQLSNGGAERQLFEACKGLIEQGIHPRVYTLSEQVNPYGPRLEKLGVPVTAISRTSHFDIRRGWVLRKKAHESRINLLHSWLIDDNPYAFLATRGTAIRYIASLRSRPCHRDRFRSLIDRLVFRSANRVIANSAEVRSHLLSHYSLPERKVSVLHNGIDFERLEPIRERTETRRLFETPEDAFVFLFVGRLHPVKRVDILIEAIRGTRPEESTYLWIAGEGEGRERLEKRVEELGIGHAVRFLGNRDDVGDLYSAADFLVLCSESEGLPNVVLESLSCGTPVLLSPGAGCAGIVIENENGTICHDRTPEGLWQSMKTVRMEKDKWASRRGSISLGARERFPMKRMVDRLVEIYRQVLFP